MDDTFPGWQIDPDTRAAMRLDRVRQAIARQDLSEAILEAEELLDEEPSHPEALFLLGECLLEVGDAHIALEAYDHCVAITGGNPQSLLGLAIARFDTCDLMGAVEAARECVRLDPGLAEAHWYLGLALECLGRTAEAVQAFAAARQLESEAYPFPLELTDAEWAAAVTRALELIHPELTEFWEGITVLFDDLPDLDALRAHVPPVPPTVSGLYDGAPPDDGDPWRERPTALRLYRRNLSRARSVEELVEQIALALQTEALDWLGLVDMAELSATDEPP